MARVTASAKEGPKPVLPLPEIVIKHHEKVLEGPQREWLSRSQVSPVILLTGLDGVGKRGLVYHLSQWILCEKTGFAGATTGSADSDDQTLDLFGGGTSSEPVSESVAVQSRGVRPCGACAACQKALSGNWTDFSEIRPEDEDGKGTLKVEQFRDLRAKMGFGSHEGVARITLIPNADRMTPQAANSMLKLLEEPPRGWLFFLTASDPTLILPTVLSRCQTIRLLPFPTPAVLELLALAQVPETRREVAAELAQGSWGKALKLGENESWERRELLFQFLEDSAPQLTPLVEWASGSPADLDLLLNQLEHALSELVLWSQSGQAPGAYPWKNRDGARKLAAHAARVSSAHGPAGARDFWVDRALRVGEIRRQSLAPLNRKILVQDLLMPWLR